MVFCVSVEVIQSKNTSVKLAVTQVLGRKKKIINNNIVFDQPPQSGCETFCATLKLVSIPSLWIKVNKLSIRDFLHGNISPIHAGKYHEGPQKWPLHIWVSCGAFTLDKWSLLLVFISWTWTECSEVKCLFYRCQIINTAPTPLSTCVTSINTFCNSSSKRCFVTTWIYNNLWLLLTFSVISKPSI